MASKGKKSARDAALNELQRLSRRRPHPNELWESLLKASDSLLVEAHKPVGALTAFHINMAQIKPIPDATFAVVVCVAVEQALELAITTHFHVDQETSERMFDDNTNGPLGTFAAKTKMGYALGLYPKAARDELDTMRTIRNGFAHSWEQISFSSPEIVACCAALRLPDTADPKIYPPPHSAKERFLISARDLYVYLEWDSVAHSKAPMRYETHPGRKVFARLEAIPK
jgi:hypothetical protein